MSGVSLAVVAAHLDDLLDIARGVRLPTFGAPAATAPSTRWSTG